MPDNGLVDDIDLAHRAAICIDILRTELMKCPDCQGITHSEERVTKAIKDFFDGK